MPHDLHLPSPTLAPLCGGRITLALSLGQVNFDETTPHSLMNEDVTLLYQGQPRAKGQLLRESGRIYVKIEQLL